MISVEYDIDDVRLSIKNIEDRIKNLRPVLVAISETMLSKIEDNFQTEGARLGKKWQELAPATIKARKSAHPILQARGRLIKSISRSVDDNSAQVGTNLIYASIHQYGGIINLAGRSETFQKLRISKGKKKGQFRKGTTEGRGFTFKGSVIKIPARPFMELAGSDIEEIKKIAEAFILKG